MMICTGLDLQKKLDDNPNLTLICYRSCVCLLKKKLQVEHSCRILQQPKVTVIDGCAIL